MSHTEEFNRIMAANAPRKKEKQQPIVEKFIEPRDNMNALQADLCKCTVAGNLVRLPFERLDNYDQVRTALLKAGATYKKSTFIFPNDAQPYIERLMGGEMVNMKKEFQYFPTPPALAQEMAAFAMRDFDCDTMMILEPSAGQGALVKELFKYDHKDTLIVHGYELNDINRSVLSKIKDFILLGDDFLNADPNIQFHRIIANPPFSKNQDVDHIRKMYHVCKKGGRIVTVASNSWRTGSQKKQVEFRNWLDEIGAVVDDIEAGTFSESGTEIATCLIIIDK